MKGRIEIRVSNNRARFHFTLERNITIVRGDSGTGKTTLYDMIAEYTRLGEASGVQVSASCPCVALVDMDWQNQLQHTRGSVVFIDDGAAFGSEMDRVMKLQKQHPDQITICLPESFEWLILQSGLLPISGLQEMLENPGRQIESADFFSWEQFFTSYLVQHSAGTYYAYSKNKLHSFYTVRDNAEKIVALIAENMPEWKE